MDQHARRIALALALVSAACGADATAPATHIAGSYKLIAVNDSSLPLATVIDFVPRTVTNGTLTVTDSTYRFTICVGALGAAGDATCGAGKLSINDSGLVWSAGSGSSFIDRTSHNSRGLIVAGDTLEFQRSDLITPRLKFVR